MTIDQIHQSVDVSPCIWDDFPARWLATVGPQIARDARPVAFTVLDGALVVLVRGEMLIEELAAIRLELLAKLPASIDGALPRRLVFKLEPGN